MRNVIKIQKRINSKTKEKYKFVRRIFLMRHDMCMTSLSMAEQKRICIIIENPPRVVRITKNACLSA